MHREWVSRGEMRSEHLQSYLRAVKAEKQVHNVFRFICVGKKMRIRIGSGSMWENKVSLLTESYAWCFQ